MKDIDFNKVNEEIIYKTLGIEGNEADALNEIYLELFEILGTEGMMKIFKHFRGDKIECPMRLYKPEFIASIAKDEADRRTRGKIARAAGYSAKVIEGIINKQKKEEKDLLEQKFKSLLIKDDENEKN